MTANDHRPEVGLVAASHAILKQFLGAAIEEQLLIKIDSKIRQAVILAIDKRPPLRRVA